MNSCTAFAELLDRYMDRELGAPESGAVARHLEGCSVCSAVVTNRHAFQARLRLVVQDAAAPAGLRERVHVQTAREVVRGHKTTRLAWPLLALAASVVLAVGTAVSYQTGHLRLTRGSQDAYIASISPGVTPVMQVALRDHVHCGVFRPATSDMPPEYNDLVHIVEQHLPPGCTILTAHLCDYRGRAYVHVIARDGSRVLSLLMTKRERGEAFEDGLRAVANATGMPIYASSVQRFNLAGFETPGHLVYLVSDFDGDRNLAMLEAMTPELRTAVLKRES